jgi:hypothetical protein
MSIQPKKIALSKDLTDQIATRIKEMEGKETDKGIEVDLTPADAMWYIAYKTIAAAKK